MNNSCNRKRRGIWIRTGVVLTALAGTQVWMQAHAEPAPAAPVQQAVRAQVGEPLRAAQQLAKERQFAAARDKIRAASAVPGLSPYETFLIDRVQAFVAANSGDEKTLTTSLTAVVGSGFLAPADRLRMMRALAGTYYREKNYEQAAHWADRVLHDGGPDPAMQDVAIDSRYLRKEYGPAAQALRQLLAADAAAGRTPSEAHLQLLLSCEDHLGNRTDAADALDRLLAAYPKKAYWRLALARIESNPKFPDRLGLDLLRLRFALGLLTQESDAMTMAQLDLQAGFPAEAQKVVDAAVAGGVFGKGPGAGRERRLEALVKKDLAEDRRDRAGDTVEAKKAHTGDALLNIGFNDVLNGNAAVGLARMERGLRQGGIAHPEDGRLHLAIAYWMAGDDAKALAAFRQVGGTDGAADLARLWAVHVAHPQRA